MRQVRLVVIVVGLLLVMPLVTALTKGDIERNQLPLPPSLRDALNKELERPLGGSDPFPEAIGNNTTDNNVYTIHGVFDPLEGELPFPDELKYNESNGYYLVQFVDRPRPSWISSLESLGATFYGRVPANAYVAFLSEEIENNPPEFVRWMGIYHPGYKLPPSIADKALNPTDDKTDILINTFVNSSETVSFIEEQNGTVVNSTATYVSAKLNETELKPLAFLDSTRFVDENPNGETYNDVATGIIGAPTLWAPPYSLKGERSDIAILDSGLDTGVDAIGAVDIHRDFNDRVTFINYYGSSPDDLNGHGTHVAGSAAGNGYEGGIRGVAPRADIIFQAAGDDYGTGGIYVGQFADFAQFFNDAYNLGARVHSNSWGFPGGYQSRSRQIDDYSWQHRDMIVVFSAGNEGLDSDSDGVIDQSSLSSPAMAKNAIIVGATENDRYMNQIDNDGDGTTDEDIPGDMNGDNWPGVQGVDDDGDGVTDLNDPEVREALEVRRIVLDQSGNPRIVDTDWAANTRQDLLDYGWEDTVHDNLNNDWDFWCDVDGDHVFTWNDEKFMDEDGSGTLSDGDVWIYDDDGQYDPQQTLDCAFGSTLHALEDEGRWDNRGLLGIWELYWVGYDRNENGIVTYAELVQSQQTGRNYNDPEVYPIMRAIVNPLYDFWHEAEYWYQAHDDDEDGLINEDWIETYGGMNPVSYPVDPLHNDLIADNHPEGMAAFSSRGPTNDGRIKPDLVAPGTWILSTRTTMVLNPQSPWNPYIAPYDDHYAYSMGTSMATPLVSGSAVLVREYYTLIRGLVPQDGVTPSSALIKATLINGAYDIAGQYGESGPIPNINEGWGRVNLPNSLPYPGNPRQLLFEEETVGLESREPPNQNDLKKYLLTLNDGTYDLKITLAWTDPPGDPTAAIALINNLDLRLISPDNEVYLGNVFSDGHSVTGSGVDTLNNVESVFIPSPVIGEYQIIVEGENIDPTFSPQPFALVVTCGDAILQDVTYSPPEIANFEINDNDDYAVYQTDNRLDFHTDSGDGSLDEMRFSETPLEWYQDTDFTGISSTDGPGWSSEFDYEWDPYDGADYPPGCDWMWPECYWSLDYPGYDRLRPHYVHLNVALGDSILTADYYGEVYTYPVGDRSDFWGEDYFGESIKYIVFSDNNLEADGMHVDKLKGYVGYPKDFEEWFKVESRTGATSLKLHFSELNIYDGDTIQIYDWLGRLVETISGDVNSLDYTSSEIPGNIAYIRFRTNADPKTGDGMTIDSVYYYDRLWTDWEPYIESTSKSWTFTDSSEGQKTVCIRVKDSNGMTDEDCDDIVLGYWSEEENLSENIIFSGENTIPRVATWTTDGGVDRIFVVWQNYQTAYWPYYTIWFRASLDGGALWTDPVCISQDTFFIGDAFEPSIDVGPVPYGNGQYVHVAFAGLNYDQVLHDIYYRRMDTNSFQWTGISQLTTHSDSDRNPDIAAIDSNVYVAWNTARFAGGWEIMKVEDDYYGSGDWSDAYRVTDYLGDAFYPRIAVDKKSNQYYLHIAWEARDAGSNIYYTLFKDAGYMYETKVNLDRPQQTSYAYFPTIDAARGKGYFMVVWVEWRTYGWQIFYRENDNGESGGWHLRDSSLTPPPGTSRCPIQAAASSVSISDTAVRVAWEDSREGPWDIFSAKKRDYELGTQPWEYYGRVTNHELGGESAEPSVSASATYLHLVYRETLAGESHIIYKRDVVF